MGHQASLNNQWPHEVANSSSLPSCGLALESHRSSRPEAWERSAEVFIFLSGIAAIWGVVFPFEVVGDDMLQREFGYSPNNAGFIIAAAPMVSIFSPALVPFLGSTLHQKLLAFRILDALGGGLQLFRSASCL